MNDSSGVKSYLDSYNTFSGCDMTIVINIPLMVNGNKIVKNYIVGEIQTLTYSTHMNRQPIRSISNVNAKDYVMGQRSIAGTMVFSVFDNHFASRIIEDLNELYGTGANILVDELPPFDINIVMANEYGHNSNIVIYGVRFINEGQVMSINDIYMENTYQYVATGIKYADNTKHNNKYIHQNKIISREDASIEYPERFPFDEPKLIYSQNINNINKERPNNYEDTFNKYQVVALRIQQHRWTGSKREISFLINQNRKSGYIIINDIKDREIATLSYEGVNTLYALPEGGYYARYVDDGASSNTKYFIITKPTVSEDNKPIFPSKPRPPYNPDDDEDELSNNGENDNPIIDDVEDDNITITENDTVIKDKEGNEFYPDREGVVYGLNPDTEYNIFYKDLKFTVKTEKNKEIIFNKLKELTINKFNNVDLELYNILYDIENEIYNKNKNIIESVYFINSKYKESGTNVHKNIMEYILLTTAVLIQNKKIIINSNSNVIPKVENFYTNKILLNKNIIKIIIEKHPYKENKPIEIYQEDFLKSRGQIYYQIQDPEKNLYRVRGINRNGVKTPSIYIFTSLGDGRKYKIDNEISSANIDEIMYHKNKVKTNKILLLQPSLLNFDDNSFTIKHDNINKNHYIVSCKSKYYSNKSRHLKRKPEDRLVTIDKYEIDINEKDVYLSWIEDQEENVISHPLVFVKDSEVNKKIQEIEKNKLYSYLTQTSQYQRLNSFNQQMLLRIIEESSVEWNVIKEKYIYSFVNNINKYNFNAEDILILDYLYYLNINGVRKQHYNKAVDIKKDRIFLKEGCIANIDVICRVTGSITKAQRKNIINLSYFKNNILIVNINNGETFYSPLLILPFNNYEVI